MELSSMEKRRTVDRQNDVNDFFLQSIERYKKSANESKVEEEDSKKPSPSHVISDESFAENRCKRRKTSLSSDGGSGSDVFTHVESEADIEKKRHASRVSSRRTREREKLRMDHFRSAELKLQQDNKKLEDENNEIRALIKKMKGQKDECKLVVQSMLQKNATAPSQRPLQQGAPSLAAPALPLSQSLPSLVWNSFLQGQGGGHAANAQQLTEEQQLLSLLNLVSVNPLLAQLLSTHPQFPKAQNDLLAAMAQGFDNNFAAAAAAAQQQQDNNGPTLNQHLLRLLHSAGGGGGGGLRQVVGAHNISGYMPMDNARSL